MGNKSDSSAFRPPSPTEILLHQPLAEPFDVLPNEIWAPQAYVSIEVGTDDKAGFRSLSFLVDTGAAISAIPMYLAKHNRIPFKKDKKRKVPIQGIGGVVDESYLNEVQIRIGGVVLSIPCLFYSDGKDQGPAILGRAGVLGPLSIHFANSHVTIAREAQ